MPEKVFGPPPRPLTPFEAEIRSFTEAIIHDVELVVVLRGHLYLERAIFALLCKSEPGRVDHFKGMTFSQKVTALQPKGLVPDEAIKGIRAINRIRNEFAHQLERTDLTADDDRNVEATLTGPLAPMIAWMVRDEPFPLQGGRVRMGLIVLYTILRKADGVPVRTIKP